MRRTTAVTTAVTMSLMLLGTTACSGDTPEENTEQACAAAEQLNVALDDFDTTVTPEATVDEVGAARDEVRQAWQELKDATADVAEDRGQELDDAWDGLQQAVDDVQGDETVSDAAESLKDEAANVQDARQAMADELGC